MTGAAEPLGEDALSAYLDSELDPATQAAVERRLAVDAEWRVVLDEVTEARRAVRSLPVRAAPPGFWARIGAEPGSDDLAALGAPPGSVSRHPTSRSWVAPRLGRVAVVAAAAAAVALAFVVPRSSPDVAPTLPALSDSHGAEAATTGDPVSQLAPLAVPVGLAP